MSHHRYALQRRVLLYICTNLLCKPLAASVNALVCLHRIPTAQPCQSTAISSCILALSCSLAVDADTFTQCIQGQGILPSCSYLRC